MPAQILDGKKLSEKIRQDIGKEIVTLKLKTGVVPGLAAILVGDNAASKVYLKNKEAACQKAGLFAKQHHLSEETSEKDLLHLIYTLNQDPHIHGILIQLPLPKKFAEQKILEAVLPEKDVDGFHPTNMGYLLSGHPSVIPCTPFGILKILESIPLPLSGKNALVVGRSNIVGKPTALLLLQQNATVTLAHSKTIDLPQKIQQADIVIAAIGKPSFIQGEWIKKGAVVIDVGINRLPDGNIVGDVGFDAASQRASYITPVPGGVGPMTITMLLWNTLQAAKKTVTQ